jgi:hypothetical protein
MGAIAGGCLWQGSGTQAIGGNVGGFAMASYAGSGACFVCGEYLVSYM